MKIPARSCKRKIEVEVDGATFVLRTLDVTEMTGLAPNLIGFSKDADAVQKVVQRDTIIKTDHNGNVEEVDMSKVPRDVLARTVQLEADFTLQALTVSIADIRDMEIEHELEDGSTKVELVVWADRNADEQLELMRTMRRHCRPSYEKLVDAFKAENMPSSDLAGKSGRLSADNVRVMI